jgi:L,D-transpeptidase YbiS
MMEIQKLNIGTLKLNRLTEFIQPGLEKCHKIARNKLFLTGLKIALAMLAIGTIAVFIYVFLVFWLPPIQDQGYRFVSLTSISAEEDSLTAAKQQSINQKETLLLQKKLDQLTPAAIYLVVNTTENKFKLYSAGKHIREGFCSTGSYTQLIADDKREWLFKTPKGIFRIRDKKKFPVWKKPDWAFVEEGLPVPTPNHSSRFEYGTLGDYSLNLGDGYLIHGTLYKRFLGMPVTHGCIRLDVDDLKAVYDSMPVGSKVYIF